MAKQTEVPGTEVKRNKHLEDLAESYRDIRNKRMKLQEKEEESRGNLMAHMLKLGLKLTAEELVDRAVYRYEDGDESFDIVLTAPRVKVKRSKANGAATAEEEPEERAEA